MLLQLQSVTLVSRLTRDQQRLTLAQLVQLMQLIRNVVLDGSGTIIIDYIVSGGIQTERHARPSIPFTGARRQAYLPDCLMGRRLLRLLIQAFVKVWK